MRNFWPSPPSGMIFIALQVRDPREDSLPDAGLLEFRDSETGETVCVDTADRTLRRRYEEDARERQKSLEGFSVVTGLITLC